jgi:glycosyltransferase involved in cell wall biosynthesis
MDSHNQAKQAAPSGGGAPPAAGPELAVIIPAFNEAATLVGVLDAVLALPGAKAWELIVVNDGSTDDTREVLERYKPRVRVIRHPSNRGYGASLKSGILATRAENVLFFDADGQHDAADIPAMVKALETYECVFTARPRNAGIPAVRKPGKWILHRVCNFLADQKIPDINSGFRAGRRAIYMLMLDLLPDGFSFSTTSLLYVIKSRYSRTFLPIRCHPRQGTSSVRIFYDGMKTLLLALRLIMLFDPFRVFGYPAMALIATGVAYQIYIVVTTRLTIVGGAILSILGGIILFHFGLLSDQIASLRKEISSHNSLFWEEREKREK